MRIFTFLIICTLIFSCTNTETDAETTTQVVADQSETSTVVEAPAEPQVEVIPAETIPKEATIPTPVQKQKQVQEQPVSKSQVTETKKTITKSATTYSSGIVAIGTVELNTVFMTDEEVAQFNREESVSDLASIKSETTVADVASINNELLSIDEIAALRQMFDDFVDEVEGFASEEDTTSETKIKVGAFDEVITITKSGKDVTDEEIFNAENKINKKSLEYIRRPKPLVDYSGYKVELMTVYNKSLDLQDQLFKTFGGLTFKNNTLTSTTYYLGDFRDAKALEDYLQKVVKTRFPKARGVKFENGLEVKYN